jgi:hypothetical protein
MHPFRRHGPGQGRVQFAAVKDHVRRAELGLDRWPKRRARQRTAILPPALVERWGPKRHLGQFRAEPETKQEPRGIRPDIDSGTDLGQPACLFVHLDVEPGLQQADRGRARRSRRQRSRWMYFRVTCSSLHRVPLP